MIDGIQPLWRSEWYPGFTSEGREWLGECDGKFYFALEISPADDEQLLEWHGPFGTRDEAKAKLLAAFERWQQRVDELWQDWEDRQIAEFDRR